MAASSLLPDFRFKILCLLSLIGLMCVCKQLPKPRPPTKWEMFAQKKGWFFVPICFYLSCTTRQVVSARSSCRYSEEKAEQAWVWWAEPGVEAPLWLQESEGREGYSHHWCKVNRWLVTFTFLLLDNGSVHEYLFSEGLAHFIKKDVWSRLLLL